MKRNPAWNFLWFIPLMIWGWNCHQTPSNNSLAQTGPPTSAKTSSKSPLLPFENPDSLIDKAYLLGKFDPSKHPLFAEMSSSITTIKKGFLRKEVIDAFKLMQKAALEDSVRLTIISATRNFDSQKRIWEAKWDGKRLVDGKDLTTVKDPVERASIILRSSSMPGSSRHHWGTDIDINTVEPAYFQTSNGAKVFAWMAKNAGQYGFCQTYTPKDSLRPYGYEEEAWHWSFTPLSSFLLSKYLNIVNYQDIHGFHGFQTAKKVHLIERYVAGINPSCR